MSPPPHRLWLSNQWFSRGGRGAASVDEETPCREDQQVRTPFAARAAWVSRVADSLFHLAPFSADARSSWKLVASDNRIALRDLDTPPGYLSLPLARTTLAGSFLALRAIFVRRVASRSSDFDDRLRIYTGSVRETLECVQRISPITQTSLWIFSDVIHLFLGMYYCSLNVKYLDYPASSCTLEQFWRFIPERYLGTILKRIKMSRKLVR